jgi:hypothetical protein
MKENIKRRRLRLERSAVSKDGSNHFISRPALSGCILIDYLKIV